MNIHIHRAGGFEAIEKSFELLGSEIFAFLFR